MNEFVKDFDIDQLIPWAKNPRINDHAVDKVANSIKKFGFASPVLARKKTKILIAGHTRIKAAKKLKMKKIPVLFLDISKEDAEKLALADNKLGEIADWDEVLLKDILSNFDLTDQLDFGWTKDELEYLLSNTEDLWEDALSQLAEGDRAPYQTMTFTFHDDQAEKIKEAIQQANLAGDYYNTENENKNGNAIHRICLFFLEDKI